MTICLLEMLLKMSEEAARKAGADMKTGFAGINTLNEIGLGFRFIMRLCVGCVCLFVCLFLFPCLFVFIGWLVEAQN